MVTIGCQQAQDIVMLGHRAYRTAMIGTRAKICGLTTAETVDAAAQAGASWIGFNHFPKSPRFISPAQARPLAARALAFGTRSVSVVVDPDDALIETILTDLAPDFIQLHGNETPQRAASLAACGIKLIKALPVSTDDDIAAAEAFAGTVEMVLFDARPPPGATLTGGLGHSFDWELFSSNPAPSMPWLLAGGLTPDNVARAVNVTGAHMVDVSSGVESAPGVKDRDLIDAFMAALNHTGRN
jgi:phosphoribosylanthranilate isomerase